PNPFTEILTMMRDRETDTRSFTKGVGLFPGDRALSVREAYDVIMSHLPAPAVEKVPLMRSLGLVLAEDVIADMDMPPWDRSQMDGYAVRSSDVTGPVELKVVDVVPAGKMSKRAVQPGEAIKIMTGAAVPEGADAVVPVEKTLASGFIVMIREAVAAGAHISRRAEDIKVGDVLVTKGSMIRSQEIGLMASVGCHAPRVIRRPTVAVLTTGDELVEVDKKPAEGQIRNSNAYSLAAQIAAIGVPYAYLGIVPDVREALAAKLKQAMTAADVVILTGGVSAGEYDLVEEVMKSIGIEIIFEKVAIKPGRPMVFAKSPDKLFFGLPGNPVSTFVTFEVFLRPALGRMMGNMLLDRPVVEAEISMNFGKPQPRDQYCPARLTWVRDHYVVAPVESHGSADLRAITKANSFLVIPTGEGPFIAGKKVKVLALDEDQGRI
ncbi:MAG: molybdopterin molybdotransferase MoeA, partial [Planctomycetes bacterium]|nr:molybdopterin molybdotransferase MoeA [Planctomycetota bacterium]